MVELEGTDEKMPAPFRPQPPRIDGHSRGRDGGVPIEIRLFHTLFRNAHANLPAPIVAAIGDDRPSVVPPLPHPVNLVSAPRAVLDGPERARSRRAQRLGGSCGPRTRFQAAPPPARRADCPGGRSRRAGCG